MYAITMEEFPALHQCLKEKNREILYDQEDGVLALNPESDLLYAYATSQAAASRMFKIAQEYEADLIIYGEVPKETLQQQTQYEGGEPFYYATYMKTIPQMMEMKGISYKELDQTHLSWVIHHYSFKECANETYISQRIQEGMLGAFVDEELVGFVGTHDSGSIGMLEVLPEFRKRGIGLNLVNRMIIRRLDQGKIPFSEIFEHNQISMKLVRKADMQLSGNTALWCTKNL